MKTKFAFTAILVCTGLYTLHAQDDERTPTTSLEFTASEIGHELIVTLTAAFDIRLAEFAAGRGDVDNTIRINADLYDVQRVHVDATQRDKVVRHFIDRATRVERLTEQRLTHGAGSRLAVLEAKAARLRGQLDLEMLNR